MKPRSYITKRSERNRAAKRIYLEAFPWKQDASDAYSSVDGRLKEYYKVENPAEPYRTQKGRKQISKEISKIK